MIRGIFDQAGEGFGCQRRRRHLARVVVVMKGDELEPICVAGGPRRACVAGDSLRYAEARISRDHGVAWLAVVVGNTEPIDSTNATAGTTRAGSTNG